MYSPFCGPSGSIASTPVANSEGHSFYPPGTGTILQAIICQETEGKVWQIASCFSTYIHT